MAEETQLILPIGLWVLQNACRQLHRWQQAPATQSLTLAINISTVQFQQPDFADMVIAEVERCGINPARLKFEITETVLVESVEAVIGKMERLQRLGITFSLDDFGTGYSSLSYLKRLPLDQLKIDLSFVRDILVDPNDAAICRAVIALGQSLGFDTIAEGVEELAQWQVLKDEGCEGAQGYLYAKPMPIEQFEIWLSDQNG